MAPPTGSYVAKRMIGLYIARGLITVVSAWPVMVALGIIHTYVQEVPAFGYLAVWVLLIAFGMVIPYQTKFKEEEV